MDPRKDNEQILGSIFKTIFLFLESHKLEKTCDSFLQEVISVCESMKFEQAYPRTVILRPCENPSSHKCSGQQEDENVIICITNSKKGGKFTPENRQQVEDLLNMKYAGSTTNAGPTNPPNLNEVQELRETVLKLQTDHEKLIDMASQLSTALTKIEKTQTCDAQSCNQMKAQPVASTISTKQVRKTPVHSEPIIGSKIYSATDVDKSSVKGSTEDTIEVLQEKKDLPDYEEDGQQKEQMQQKQETKSTKTVDSRDDVILDILENLITLSVTNPKDMSERPQKLRQIKEKIMNELSTAHDSQRSSITIDSKSFSLNGERVGQPSTSMSNYMPGSAASSIRTDPPSTPSTSQKDREDTATKKQSEEIKTSEVKEPDASDLQDESLQNDELHEISGNSIDRIAQPSVLQTEFLQRASVNTMEQAIDGTDTLKESKSAQKVVDEVIVEAAKRANMKSTRKAKSSDASKESVKLAQKTKSAESAAKEQPKPMLSTSLKSKSVNIVEDVQKSQSVMDKTSSSSHPTIAVAASQKLAKSTASTSDQSQQSQQKPKTIDEKPKTIQAISEKFKSIEPAPKEQAKPQRSAKNVTKAIEPKPEVAEEQSKSAKVMQAKSDVSQAAAAEAGDDFVASPICECTSTTMERCMPSKFYFESQNEMMGHCLFLNEYIADEGDLSEFFALNFEAIKRSLIRDDIETKLKLIQALRWRLTKTNMEVRSSNVVSYVRNDILFFDSGPSGTNRDFFLETFFYQKDFNSPQLREDMARFVNTLASLNFGREYLTKDKRLLERILIPITLETKNASFTDSCRVFILVTIQKLSLCKEMRDILIRKDFLEWLVVYLTWNHKNMGNYEAEYAVALLTNLCIHKETTKRCVRMLNQVIKLLFVLADTPHKCCMNYLNNIFYTLLSNPTINNKAIEDGFTDKLFQLHEKMEDDAMRLQLEIIITIHSSTDPASAMCHCEGEEQQQQFADFLEPDLDANDMFYGDPCGEEFLLNYRIIVSKGNKVQVLKKSCACTGTCMFSDQQKRPKSTRSRHRESKSTGRLKNEQEQRANSLVRGHKHSQCTVTPDYTFQPKVNTNSPKFLKRSPPNRNRNRGEEICDKRCKEAAMAARKPKRRGGPARSKNTISSNINYQGRACDMYSPELRRNKSYCPKNCKDMCYPIQMQACEPCNPCNPSECPPNGSMFMPYRVDYCYFNPMMSCPNKPFTNPTSTNPALPMSVPTNIPSKYTCLCYDAMVEDCLSPKANTSIPLKPKTHEELSAFESQPKIQRTP